MKSHFLLPSVILFSVGLSTSGCGHRSDAIMQESTLQDQPSQSTALTDSLAAENQRLRDQVNALAAENRALSARITQLEGARPAEVKETPVRTPQQAEQTTPEPAVAPAGQNATYDQALALVRKRDFQDGIEAFKALLARGIAADLIDNCHYWMGEAYFAQKQFDQAAREFQTVLDYEGSEKANDARLMLGNSYASLGKTDAAKRAFNELIGKAPGSPAAKRAKARLAGLK